MNSKVESTGTHTRSVERSDFAQEVFDLVASLLEDINMRQDQPGSGVWDAAGEFCERMRDSGMKRNKFACDYDGRRTTEEKLKHRYSKT